MRYRFFTSTSKVLTDAVEVGTLSREVRVLPCRRRRSCEVPLSIIFGEIRVIQCCAPLSVKLPLVYCSPRCQCKPGDDYACTYHCEVKPCSVDTAQTRDRRLPISKLRHQGRREERKDGEHCCCCDTICAFTLHIS